MIDTRTAPTPPRRVSRAIISLTIAVVLAFVLGACGHAPDREVQASSPGAGNANASAPAAPAANGLPTLPPAAQRMPDRFDAQGCLRVSPTQSDCAQTANALDASAAGKGTGDWRTLAGFVGRDYTTDLQRDAFVVLDDTVNVASTPTGRWKADGLARNEHANAVASVSIEATLKAADGSTIETLNADSPVTSIRPGEPVPFTLASDKTTATDVASVQWNVIEHAGTIDASGRTLELNTYWSRPFGDPRPVDMYLHHDTPGATPAYLLFGSVTNDGTAAIHRPHVVVAWLSRDGKVVAVRDVPASDPSGTATESLATGSPTDFLAAIDDPSEGQAAGGASPMLWGGSR